MNSRVCSLLLGMLFIQQQGAFAENLNQVLNVQPLATVVNVSRTTRNPQFQVPAKLRVRVNFWISIFAHYGKNQSVVHHRRYPQAVFEVLDFREQAESMGPIELSKYKESRIKETIKRYNDSFKRIVEGQAQGSFDEHVLRVMQQVPGGVDKFQKVLDEEWVRTQTGIRERTEEAIARSGRYLPLLEQIFVIEYGLPVELTRLPFVESSFDYTAYSSVGAAGIWQFMPGTAKRYMMVNKLIDERKDPLASSRAAAQYLEGAKQRLGGWGLAMTSYNHGIAGVLKRMKEAQTTDISEMIENPDKQVFGFASQNFFPSFLAALEIYERRFEFFPHVQMEPALSLKEIPLTSAASLAHVAKQLGVSKESLIDVNYAFSKAIIDGKSKIPAGYKIRVRTAGKSMEHRSLRAPDLTAPKPVRQEPIKPQAIPSKSKPTAVSKVYVVKPGETLYELAKRYKVSVVELQRANKLKTPRIVVGQKLILP